MLKEQSRFFSSVLMAADLGVIVTASIGAYFAHFHWLRDLFPPRESLEELSYAGYALPIVVAAPLMMVAMIWAGMYQPRRDQRFYREAFVILKGVTVGVGLTIVFLSLFRNVLFDGRQYSAMQFAMFGALATALLLVWRYAFRTGLRMIRKRGWNLRHVAVIGTGRLGQVACRTFNRNSWTGVHPAYFIHHDLNTSIEQCCGLKVRGGLDELETILDEHPVSGVVIATPGEMAARLPELMLRLERYPLEVRVIPDVNPKYMPINLAVNTVDGMPILSVRQSPMASGWGRVMKRAVDVFGGIAALLIFGIPMLIIAAVIRFTSDGPAIFRQQRMSINGQPFSIYKFRTMKHVDQEQQMIDDAGKGTDAWTQANDPRVTPIGKFLRKTSLDELPQLFNVLLGEMSLVGPRPERPELIEDFREDWRGYMLRQQVKAGMTGWAQVNGLRGDTDLKKRLQYDLFYIRNWSLVFDIRILWMTLFRGFVHPNAN